MAQSTSSRFRGLSPRVRGNRISADASSAFWRSIPACAGEPRKWRRSCGRGGVYPRVCGGTVSALRRGCGRKGLSPRVRGNPMLQARGGQLLGSIPACAGEPDAAARCYRAGEVYPRVCGGTCCTANCGMASEGLSPRVRGNPPERRRRQRGARSIPACAGEPRSNAGRASIARVYPRVCGGTGGDRAFVLPVRGLSPRVRGNLQQAPNHAAPVGSIPACAGEPWRRRLRSASGRVYPRVCGGTTISLVAGDMAKGLSPRVRGNP